MFCITVKTYIPLVKMSQMTVNRAAHKYETNIGSQELKAIMQDFVAGGKRH